MAQDTVILDGELSLDLNNDGDITLDILVDGEAGTVVKVTEHDLPAYTGPINITPSENTQVLQTADKTVLQNIVIGSIPSNYGLITWDGTKLTIT